MIKLLETIFRRFILLLLMLFVPIIIGPGIAYTFPPSYQASATLWALQRFEVIGLTGPESDLATTPAGTQADALTELLQTQVFDVAVGNASDLKSTLKLSTQALPNSQVLNDAYVADISTKVQVVAKGTNLYEISYANSNPYIAAEVLKAVITEFQVQGRFFSIIEGQRLLEQDKSQLPQIQGDAITAATKEAIYITSHPESTITNDPQYALLDGQRLQAQSVLQNMENVIADLKQTISSQSAGGGTFFKTLDPPIQPNTALSRLKNLTIAAGIGAAIGLITCILYMLIILRRDRALYSALDVEKVTSYSVLMQIPQLSKARNTFTIATPDVIKSGVPVSSPVKYHEIKRERC